MWIFDHSLDDLIKSLRKEDENNLSYISQCLEKIKIELRHKNMAIKTNAVTKLLYLQMHGWNNNWAAFPIIEVMSSTKFHFKRMGYLAASQSFHENLDVLILSTNTIKKDINSQNMYESGIAMSALSNFVTPTIAKYLFNDIITLSNSTKPYLRKRATLLLYHMCLHHDKAEEQVVARLIERLEDSDPSVQLAAVNVMCEVVRKNPSKYLHLTPILLNLMKNAPNNWMLIKVIKLFCVLVSEEPRLSKKLVGSLSGLIHSTMAMSLLYECLNALLVCIADQSIYDDIYKVCAEKLRLFIQASDKNLKYLGLLTMSRVLKMHQNSVEIHKDLVLECLEDRDHSIKHRALDLLQGMVCKKNIRYVVEKLVIHMEKSSGVCYRDLVIGKIIEICSQSNYAYMTKFEWYICILIDLTKMKGTKKGRLISDQLIDLCLRFQSVRSFLVSKMSMLIENGDFLYRQSNKTNISEVMRAAFWVCGEYVELLKKPQRTMDLILLNTSIKDLATNIQILFTQSVFKIYVCLVKYLEDENNFSLVRSLSENLYNKLEVLAGSDDLELQERTSGIRNLIKVVKKYHSKYVKVSHELLCFCADKLLPVEEDEQKRVPVPDGLNLDLWINEPIFEHPDKQNYAEINFQMVTEKQEPQKQLKLKNKARKKKVRKRHSTGNVEDVKQHPVTESLLMFED